MDVQAGVYVYKHDAEEVKRGDKLFRIYSNSETRLQFAREHLEKNSKCYAITPSRAEAPAAEEVAA